MRNCILQLAAAWSRINFSLQGHL